MSGRILIVDDVAANRIVLQARLAAACYDPVMADDGAACLAAARSGPDLRPDLILLALALPDQSGVAVLRQLREDARCLDIPVIALAAKADDGAGLEALAAGADDVIEKSAPDRFLLARVRNLLRARVELAAEAGLASPGLSEPPAAFKATGTIALVSAEPQTGLALASTLGCHLRDRLVVLDRLQAMDQSVAGPADVFVLVLRAEEAASTVLRLLSDLKSRMATRHAAVLVVGLDPQGDEAAMAYDLGADDVVGPAVGTGELALRLRGLLRRKDGHDRQRVRVANGLRLALVDPLTGLYNRRHAVPALMAIAARAAEEGTSYAVMVVDLDRFKAVNDRFGHAAGDAVLVEVARRLRVNLRDGDLLARIGGEEFLVALPETPIEEARLVAERLCASVHDSGIAIGAGQSIGVTISIGVAAASHEEGHEARQGAFCGAIDGAIDGTSPAGSSRPQGPAMIEAVVGAADRALMEAKGAGRNQVTIHQTAA